MCVAWARLEGKVVFVRNALPGERVLAKLTYGKRHFFEATAVEILEASSERVTPPCAHANVCGGCSLQHWRSDKQIEQKQAVLAEQLQHFGGLMPEQGFLPPLLGPTEQYRRKARLACKYVRARERVFVGFREAASHYVTDVSACAVLDERVSRLLPALSVMMTGLDAREKIPQIEVAVGDDEIAFVVRHLEPLTDSDRQAWVKFCQSEGITLYLQSGGVDTVCQIWPEAGAERLVTRIPELDLTYSFHPLDFLQVNKSINDQLVLLALDLLDVQATDRVLDLFSGLGNFTLPLARRAQAVTGVEVSATMVSRGRENAAQNGLKNVSFFQTDLTQAFEQQPWFGVYDKVLIDPPRSGAAEVVSRIAALNPRRVVYVSCNPATLARDVSLLAQAGYRLQKAGVLDMFPHTMHVESIAVLARS
ncbi:MAG: 23S rRNA (uracil(1939)-C(5))-methyltransferase RlmD [Gammaproteobacteria bacterium]